MPAGDYPFKPTIPEKINPRCYLHNGLPWWGILPPTCTCYDPPMNVTITTIPPIPSKTEERLSSIEKELAYIKELLEKLTK